MAVARRECLTCGFVFPNPGRREAGTKSSIGWHEERGHTTRMVRHE